MLTQLPKDKIPLNLKFVPVLPRVILETTKLLTWKSEKPLPKIDLLLFRLLIHLILSAILSYIILKTT